jgi:hypothetical protein
VPQFSKQHLENSQTVKLRSANSSFKTRKQQNSDQQTATSKLANSKTQISKQQPQNSQTAKLRSANSTAKDNQAQHKRGAVFDGRHSARRTFPLHDHATDLTRLWPRTANMEISCSTSVLR